MDKQSLVIILLIGVIIVCVGVIGFLVFNSGGDSGGVVVNNTTSVNDTNDTVNATKVSSSSSSSSSGKSSNSKSWNEVQDLSELYDDGKKHTVTIHHDGSGGISWTDDEGYHTGREGEIKSW